MTYRRRLWIEIGFHFGGGEQVFEARARGLAACRMALAIPPNIPVSPAREGSAPEAALAASTVMLGLRSPRNDRIRHAHRQIRRPFRLPLRTVIRSDARWKIMVNRAVNADPAHNPPPSGLLVIDVGRIEEPVGIDKRHARFVALAFGHRPVET